MHSNHFIFIAVEALFARERRGLNPAEAGEAAIKHFLQGARFVIRQRGTKLYEKKGEYIDALREFQSLKPSGLKQHETKMGTEKMVVGMVGDRKIRLMTDTGNNIGWPPYTILHISSTKKGELPYKIVYRNNL